MSFIERSPLPLNSEFPARLSTNISQIAVELHKKMLPLMHQYMNVDSEQPGKRIRISRAVKKRIAEIGIGNSWNPDVMAGIMKGEPFITVRVMGIEPALLNNDTVSKIEQLPKSQIPDLMQIELGKAAESSVSSPTCLSANLTPVVAVGKFGPHAVKQRPFPGQIDNWQNTVIPVWPVDKAKLLSHWGMWTAGVVASTAILTRIAEIDNVMGLSLFIPAAISMIGIHRAQKAEGH